MSVENFDRLPLGAPIKAIPTEYGGIFYRSRTEARWAVFFTVAEVKFQYEPDGFDLDGIPYLPDFWLPDWRLFVEVKPFADPQGIEVEKCKRLARASGRPVLMVRGDPGMRSGLLFGPNDDEPGSTTAELGTPAAFPAICRRCPRIILTLVWGDSQAWGEHPLFGPCEMIANGSLYCHDRISDFGCGFEKAIQAAVEFTWKPKKRATAA